MERIVDFRSDTITLPTKEMREAMYNASLGDDVYGEDPTVLKLEELAANKLGKEAALFVTSGTMGNLISVMTHTLPGDEVLLEEEAHIYYYEVGGMARIAGVMPRLVKGEIKGIITPDDVKKYLRPKNIHFPTPRLLSLENTHNRGGGITIPNELMKELYNFAKEHDLNVHMDGARIFNAAIAQNIDVKEIAQYADSVMFCLSKGLSAPIGSIILGSKDFIERARKNRKVVGGGMRQAGVIAAAGIVAITKMVNRLKIDHENAQLLREGISKIEGLSSQNYGILTNIVVFSIELPDMDAYKFVNILNANGIKSNPLNTKQIRFVTNRHITEDDVYYALEKMKEVMKKYV